MIEALLQEPDIGVKKLTSLLKAQHPNSVITTKLVRDQLASARQKAEEKADAARNAPELEPETEPGPEPETEPTRSLQDRERERRKADATARREAVRARSHKGGSSVWRGYMSNIIVRHALLFRFIQCKLQRILSISQSLAYYLTQR